MPELTVLSRPHQTVWMVTLQAAPDNRLTPTLLDELAIHLDTVEAEWRRAGGGQPDPRKRGEHKGAGALIITSSCPKFFSNGLDPSSLRNLPQFFERDYDPVMYRLLTFPLVTVAAINGHAFAGGMVLSLCCDFRIMTSSKGLVCMNELQIGLPLPNSFAAFLPLKITQQHVLRDTMLGRRWKQNELLELGILDEVVDDGGDSSMLLKHALDLSLREGIKVAAGSWGAIKDGLYHAVIDASKTSRQVLLPAMEAKAFWTRVGGEKAKL